MFFYHDAGKGLRRLTLIRFGLNLFNLAIIAYGWGGFALSGEWVYILCMLLAHCWGCCNNLHSGSHFSIFMFTRGHVFRPLWSSYVSLLIQRNVTKRKDTRHARPTGALRCSNEPAGCELATLGQHIPKPPPHPVLLGEPEREVGDQEQRRRTKD